MRKLSYFPPTTESDAAILLNKTVKDVKKLKSKSILGYKGKLICNLSLGEYLKGGCGYDDSLSINLQTQIDENIEKQYKAYVFRKKISQQLIDLYDGEYIKVFYKNTEMMKPTNIFAIKKVEWTDKVKTATNFVFEKLKSEIIYELSYNHHKSFVDDRYAKPYKKFVSEIRKFGFVAIFTNLIEQHLEFLNEHKLIVDNALKEYDDETQKLIKAIQKLYADLDYAEFNLSMNILIPFYAKTKAECETKIAELSKDERFDEYHKLASDLDINNEIDLWIRFRNKLNEKNHHHYNDFVTEFNDRDDVVNNNLISKTELLEIVNYTKQLYKLKTIDSVETAIDEMKNKLDWNYNF